MEKKQKKEKHPQVVILRMELMAAESDAERVRVAAEEPVHKLKVTVGAAIDGLSSDLKKLQQIYEQDASTVQVVAERIAHLCQYRRLINSVWNDRNPIAKHLRKRLILLSDAIQTGHVSHQFQRKMAESKSTAMIARDLSMRPGLAKTIAKCEAREGGKSTRESQGSILQSDYHAGISQSRIWIYVTVGLFVTVVIWFWIAFHL